VTIDVRCSAGECTAGAAPSGPALDRLGHAEAAFRRAHPDFDPGGRFAVLRDTEYRRLDATGQVYLDHAGSGLYAASQLDAHAALLRRHVLGNPHSENPTSRASTELVERCRRAISDHFHAPLDEFACIFTSNATAALRLVGESYPFRPGATFALTADNHNSVNGIREFARRAGARVAYVPVVAPELRVDRGALGAELAAADRTAERLLAFPAQSNFSGVQHPLDLVAEAHEAGWDVLLDATAFAPTNRLDLAAVGADFTAVSFYKIVGFPTGVGCLLARRDRLAQLARPWFSGGTVTTASVLGDGHHLRPGAEGFEDGTVDFLNIPAVEHGLRFVDEVGIDAVHRRVAALTAWLLDALGGLRHRNGQRMVRIHGPTDVVDRGGTIAFLLRDPDGRVVDERWVERLANDAGISLRTGCFCNPGAGEAAHGLRADHIRGWFDADRPVSFGELRDGLAASHGRVVSAIRVSLGLATNFADVHRFMCFLERFLDHTVQDLADDLATRTPADGSPG
jgi:selenocysteine lyase/cysteine desulfurase